MNCGLEGCALFIVGFVAGYNGISVKAGWFQIGGIPSPEEFTLIGKPGRDEFNDGPVLKEHCVEKEKRFEDHLNAGRAGFIDIEKACQFWIGSGAKKVFELHPL